MTDEQLQRIHDIEYSCDSREELAERIVALEDELAQWERLTAGVELPDYPISQFQPKNLERENVKLKRAAERDADVMEALNLSLEESQAENAKLRELVADTYQAFQRVIPDGHRLDLEQRMRELGMEVDG